jgi:hypothetical protein
MKIPPFRTVLFLTLASLSQALAANRPVDGVKLNYSLIGSPQIAATIPLMTQAKKPRIVGPNEPPAVWLEVEAEFDSFQEFPELSFKYSLILMDKQGTPRLLEGEVVHVDVAPGRERHSVMYIAPKTLNRLSDNKAFSVNNIAGVYVEISSGGQLIAFGQKSVKLTYEKFAKARESLTDKLTDAFLNKNQTPFAPLFFDYHEAIKPSAR